MDNIFIRINNLEWMVRGEGWIQYFQVHRSILFGLILNTRFGVSFKVTIEAKGAPRLDPNLLGDDQGSGQQDGEQTDIR